MVIKKNLVAIIQARYNSAPFPEKILKKIKDKTSLEISIKKLQKSKYINKIVVAPSTNFDDLKIKDAFNQLHIEFFQGLENDVLDRYYKVGKFLRAKNIIRITSDRPLIDPTVVDKVIIKYFAEDAEYTTYTMPATYPDGYDVEIFKFTALKEAWQKSKKRPLLKEHVTTYIRLNPKFRKRNVALKKNYSFFKTCH